MGDTHKPQGPKRFVGLPAAEWLAAIRSGEVRTHYRYPEETLDGISRLHPTTRESVRQGCWTDVDLTRMLADLAEPPKPVAISDDLVEMVLELTRSDDQARRDWDPMLAFVGVSSADLCAAAGEIAAQGLAERLNEEIVTPADAVVEMARANQIAESSGSEIERLRDELAAERRKSAAYERILSDAGAEPDLEADLALRCRTAALLLEDLAASLRFHSSGGES